MNYVGTHVTTLAIAYRFYTASPTVGAVGRGGRRFHHGPIREFRLGPLSAPVLLAPAAQFRFLLRATGFLISR